MTWWHDPWSLIMIQCLLSNVYRLKCSNPKLCRLTHLLTRVKSRDASASKNITASIYKILLFRHNGNGYRKSIETILWMKTKHVFVETKTTCIWRTVRRLFYYEEKLNWTKKNSVQTILWVNYWITMHLQHQWSHVNSVCQLSHMYLGNLVLF